SKVGGPFEMVQLWVNLPKKDKLTKPNYQALEAANMGKLTLPNNAGFINIIAGDLNGIKGPATTYSPVNLWDIKLNAGGSIVVEVAAKHNTALLLIEGNATVNGEVVKEHSFVLFKNEGEAIEISTNENAVLLLLSGEPLNEPIASYGPFVMNTQAEIYEAIEEFQNGKFGELH
ncbi:MAG: pirin-like C-terminal cupin domain-containing protein, partial [Ferruginibacter sp.]